MLIDPTPAALAKIQGLLMISGSEITNQDGAASASVDASGTSAGKPAVDQHPEASSIQDQAPPITEEEFNADYERYLELVPVDVPARGIADDAWQKDLIMVKHVKKDTKEEFFLPEKKSQNNIYLLARYSETTRGIFILNEFSRRKMVVKCPPWEKPSKFKPRDIRDDDYARICMELERQGLAPTKDRAISAIEAICHDRSFHPVQKYFRSLKWDSVPRLHNWLTFYLGAEYDPQTYLSGVGIKWMVAAVARIFHPGCKFDHMLVLEGSTDIGKSAALRKLSTFHGEEYFYDGMTFAKISDKDTMQNIQGSLIIEFPELSSLQSREVEDVKQWITIQEDRGRKPYGREPVVYPRQFVLAGTTNNNEYLKDMTGNKRFWPVRCGDRIDMAALEKDRGQLWAEAAALYHAGYKWWIPEGDPLFEVCAGVARKRLTTHPWEEAVLEYIHMRQNVTVNEILIKKIEKKLENVKKSDEMAIASILKNNGFIKRSDGKQRLWERKEMQLNLGDMA